MEKSSQSHFFSFISRMKYINRWGLMRNTKTENISEHSLDVAIIAHALAVINNKRYNGKISPERAALLGIFHDVSEIITGDLPTPIKYYSREIKSAYSEVEKTATNSLLEMLPEDIKGKYESLLRPDDEEKELWKLVKAADKISALIKCIEEREMGNREFIKAEDATRQAVVDMNLPEVNCFLTEFLPSFSLTLDEQ